MRTKLLIFFLSLISIIQAQDLKYYRYDQDWLSKEFFKGRRDSVRSQMPDHSIAILFSAPERNRSNDDDFQYHQNPNFYYLTGFTEPNAMLFIFKEAYPLARENSNEYIFLQDRDPEKEVWTGRRLGVEGSKELLGIPAFTDETFDTLEFNFKNFGKIFYLPMPKGVVDDKSEPADLFDLIEQFKKKSGYPSENGDGFLLSRWLSAMREIKQPEELVLMHKVVSISCDGHIEMMKALKPRMTEYQAQAVGEYVFKQNGSEYVGYPSICGGGENSCILHYENNRKPLNANDVLLLDMGAEYHGYSADVTRTIPVSGKFSPEQKAIYQIVYDAQEAAFKECKPGSEFAATGITATAVIKQGLMDLGIIKDDKGLRRYFMHGTSHYLGLDVHDAGTRGNLKAGNIITVEPGIYIPEGSPCDPKWWNIGIRIEDDILITETGFENLSAKAPRSIDKIEEMMKQKSSLVPK